MMERQAKLLTPHEWEALIEDFQFGGSRQERRLLQYPSLTLLDLALTSILRKDSPVPLKTHLLVFLEEHAPLIFPDPLAPDGLDRLLDAIRSLVQSPVVDTASPSFSLKEQFMVSTTSIIITLDALTRSPHHLEALAELLLNVINRPNHGVDRQTRSIACECLRELDGAFPCLLADVAGHLWNLCQSERTHAFQSYLLLLTSVIHNLIVARSPLLTANASVLATSIPLVPFNVPHILTASAATETATTVNYSGLNSNSVSVSGLNSRELRRVVAFLLDQPQILTPCGMLEFMWMLLGIAAALDLQPSLLKVQFSGLLYSYDPILCHCVLMLYSHFSDSLDGGESEVARRLMLISKEIQQYLVFRLLTLHWLLGFKCIKKQSIMPMVSSFYPTVFDPLALKSLKLDIVAYCAVCLESTLGSEDKLDENLGSGATVVKLFEDGLVCVSAFKWLPPWSTETAVAFRMLHKFLVSDALNSGSDYSSVQALMESTIFRTLQTMLVNLAVEFCRLVPVIIAFVDRLLACSSHCCLGERLLQTFDEHLLSKLATDYLLASYFPIFYRIAENETIPPRSLLELLTAFMVALVEKHGPDTGLKSWSQGSKVLGICRTMLMHHHSSRVFLPLSQLLAFTCQFFPDLEVRDSARVYLRMLLCIPGKKLRHILNLGEQLPGVSPSPHLSAYFQSHSPHPPQDLNKSLNISSYIYFERVIPLLVKQSWSLAISSSVIEKNKLGYFEEIGDSDRPIATEKEGEGGSDIQLLPEAERIEMPWEPLRVMDAKVAEILEILRRHFASIPDFRHMPGLKIRIPCTLRFESEPFNRIWGVDSSSTNVDGVDALPALYAAVISFTSSASYGPIASFHIPFLLGEPSQKECASVQKDCLDIVPTNGSGEVEEGGFRAPVVIELEPREPMPGLVNVAIEANAENGQIIRGPLQSIAVGIEDIFLKAIIPSDVAEDAVPKYYSDLFFALWDACSNSSNTGRETFPLKGGKGIAAIYGTRSVKLLEVDVDSLIGAVERYLTPFIVNVTGQPLTSMVKDNGVIKDIVWEDESMNDTPDAAALVPYSDPGPPQLEYFHSEKDADGQFDIRKRNMGCFHVLIFLPPRFHLLFQMEVSDVSTLVLIRTDHWPCLAYIDDYLESLFFT